MSHEPGALGLVERIYAAALEPERWPLFLTLLGKAIQADALCIFLRYPEVNDPGQVFTVGVDAALPLVYTHYYFTSAPWDPRAGAVGEGRVVSGEDAIPFEKLEQTEFYKDWMRPNGFRHLLGANLRDRGGAGFLNLGALRSQDSVPFGSAERQLCELLVPHLQRAIEIHERVHRIGPDPQAMRHAVDQVSMGVLAVDAMGRVVWANPAAQEILKQADGLIVGPDGVGASDLCETALLRQLILEAAAVQAGDRNGAEGPLSLTRSSGRRPLNLLVSPVPPSIPDPGQVRGVAAIFVSDPDEKREAPIDLLRILYGLTPAEAALAALLGAGHTLSEAAQRLGIVPSTARTQLRSIFLKTNTHQQSALVRLLSAGVASLRRS